MTETQNSDHWKSLADEVGAEAPSEAVQTSDDTSFEEAPLPPKDVEPKPRVSPKPSKPKPAPQSENHWGLIAGELGLDVPASELAVPSSTQTSDVASEEVSSAADNSARSAFETQELPDQSSPVSSTAYDESLSNETADYVDDRFAQDADFGDEEDDKTNLTDIASDEPVGEPASIADEDESDEEEAESRPRRRRRRRRRTSRKSRDERNDKSDEDSAESDLETIAADDEPDASVDSSKADEEAAEEEEEDQRMSGQKAKHRKIPTWEETIGVVVTANLDARTANPSGTGRRGRGRGRGRK